MWRDDSLDVKEVLTRVATSDMSVADGVRLVQAEIRQRTAPWWFMLVGFVVVMAVIGLCAWTSREEVRQRYRYGCPPCAKESCDQAMRNAYKQAAQEMLRGLRLKPSCGELVNE